MKTILVLITLLSSSFGFAQSWFNNGTVGNKNITTEKISTEAYDVIKLVGSMDVHLEKGAEGEITVTTDENLHELLEIEVVGEELIIKTKSKTSYSTKHGIHITVPFEDISAVKLKGSGDIDTKDPIIADEFYTLVDGSGDIILKVEATEIEAKVAGSGDIKLELEAAKIKANVGGSGDIYLSGTTTNLDANVNGSGDIRAYDLNAENTDVSVNGSGDAKVVANENLIARVNGSGDIRYKGNPANRDVKISGSGDVDAY